MAVTAVLGQGTSLERGDGASPDVFNPIEGISNLSGPTASTDQLDVTALDGSARVFISGLLDPGEITFSAFYDPTDAQQKLIEDDFTAGTEQNWKLIFGSAATDPECTFAATPTGYSVTANADGPLTLDVTLKISGAVTWPT